MTLPIAAGLFEEEARGRMVEGRNQHSSPRANLPEPSRARDQAATLCGVSPRSVESASKVKARGAPGLVDAVRKGEVAARLRFLAL